jgi:hypothetical protein
MTIQERANYITASDECEKLMYRYCYLICMGKNREAYDRLFSSREDITMSFNDGQLSDRYSVYQSFVLDQEQAALDNFVAVRKRYPQLATVKDTRRMLRYRKPLMNNMVFELAEDGQSAKAVFVTLSYDFVTLTAHGQMDCRWIMARHAADFILEDGEWKILNMAIYTDAEGMMDTYQWPLNQTEPLQPGEYDIPGQRHQTWNPTVVPQNSPAVPEPYKTYEKANSYAAI